MKIKHTTPPAKATVTPDQIWWSAAHQGRNGGTLRKRFIPLLLAAEAVTVFPPVFLRYHGSSQPHIHPSIHPTTIIYDLYLNGLRTIKILLFLWQVYKKLCTIIIVIIIIIFYYVSSRAPLPTELTGNCLEYYIFS